MEISCAVKFVSASEDGACFVALVVIQPAQVVLAAVIFELELRNESLTWKFAGRDGRKVLGGQT
jgi:hypothetical protein